MKTQKQKIGENLLYGMVWLVVFLIPILNSKLMSEMHVDLDNIIIAWYKIAPYFIAFLIHDILLCPLLMRKRYVTYVLGSTGLLFVIFLGIYLYEGMGQSTDELLDMISARHASFTNLEWYWNVCLGIFMFGTNDFIKLLYSEIRKETEMERLKRQGLQAEIDYLKYQINPHFFMNTLNNIHALIDIDAQCAKDSIIELSKMMRYVLYESGSERIPLERDLTFIANYIELMRIRYSGDVDIRFTRPEHIPADVGVTPLIFIVFVENAFKHGISYKTPSYIHITVDYSETDVHAHFENSRHPQPAQKQTGGIGLENVRKRLDLTYPGRYTLRIDDTRADTYSVDLTIPVIK